MSVADRIKQQNGVLMAQSAQLRLILGVLVKRLGSKQAVSQVDFDAMAKEDVRLFFTAVPQPPDAEGRPVPDVLELEVLSGEEAKAREAAAPRIAPPEPPRLIVVP